MTQSDNPRRVAGPGELREDSPTPAQPDPLEAYGRMLDFEDAERALNERRPLELTGGWVDEAAQIPQETINKLAPRSVDEQFAEVFKR
jgi:hypothetical protein